MSIPASHMMERLSVAYISAVAAKAGIKLFGEGKNEYGIDVYMQAIRELPNGTFTECGHILQCQIKSTTNSIIKNKSIVYDMKVEDYNKLVMVDTLPRILLLYRLPMHDEKWLSLDEEKLLLQHCCYWAHIVGPPSKNKSSRRISIPRTQIFTPESARDLLIKLEQGYFES